MIISYLTSSTDTGSIDWPMNGVTVDYMKSLTFVYYHTTINVFIVGPLFGAPRELN